MKKIFFSILHFQRYCFTIKLNNLSLLLILLLFFGKISLINSQNLLLNPSFEDCVSNTVCAPNMPLIFGQLGRCKNWTSVGELVSVCKDQNCPTCENPNSCEIDNKGSSPDWYKNVSGGLAVTGVQGSTGSGYVGAALREMIQQNLSNTLTAGRRYRVTMKVRLTPTILSFSTTSLFKGCLIKPVVVGAIPKSKIINVFTSKNKITYESWLTSSNKTEGLSPKVSIPIPPSATDGWVETFGDIFIGLDEEVNWIALEPDEESSVLIDDVSLELIPVAECPCGPESGPINLTSARNLSTGLPMLIKNTSNLSHIKVEVFIVTGQNPVRTIEIDHPRCVVEFDGRSDFGTLMPTQTYIIKVTARNECEEKRSTIQAFFDIFSNVAIPSFPSYPNKLDISATCCVPNINLNKNTLLVSSCNTNSTYGTTAGQVGSMAGTFNVNASKSINISDGVSFLQSNITFTAPATTVSSIPVVSQVLSPGVKIVAGNPMCPIRRFGRIINDLKNIATNDVKSNLDIEEDLKNVQSEKDNINFKVYPNPHSEAFVLKNKSDDLSLIGLMWELFDARGVIHQKGIFSENETKITTIGMPTGLYFIKINTPIKIHILSIVKE